jgi:outer membrane lipase/esterase
MKNLTTSTAAALRASAVFICGLGLAAAITSCGSSDDKPQFTSIVVFGSSLSDVGSYKTGAIEAAGGGRSTINPGKIWVEHLADAANVGIKAGMVGFAGTSTICPKGACTGWAQGGSRITNPNGVSKSLGLLTVPVVQQMDLQLAQKSSYSANDLVIVASGPNDVYVLADGIAATTAALVATGVAPATAQAQALQGVSAGVVTAGNELVDAIEKKILAKGATYVAILTSDDIVGTPTAAGLGATNTAIVSQLIALLNSTIADGIKAKNLAVVTIDTSSFTKLVLADPAAYGIANKTDAACDPAKIALATNGLVTTGNALLCSAATLKAGANADTWMYADTAHYASRMHKLLSEFVVRELAIKGWF